MRKEAGLKLRGNHARVLKDICNPSAELNIDGKPLTQLELTRVAPEHEPLADMALRELESRLLGEGSSQPTAAAAKVWATMAAYLIGRIHGTLDQKPGRTPDMSAPAAEATREVLEEMLVAAGRQEAGLRLRGNHARVLQDVCNPSREKNIDGKPLTQLELVRVAPEHEAHAGDTSLKSMSVQHVCTSARSV